MMSSMAVRAKYITLRNFPHQNEAARHPADGIAYIEIFLSAMMKLQNGHVAFIARHTLRAV
jgi:hypothetical protein